MERERWRERDFWFFLVLGPIDVGGRYFPLTGGQTLTAMKTIGSLPVDGVSISCSLCLRLHADFHGALDGQRMIAVPMQRDVLKNEVFMTFDCPVVEPYRTGSTCQLVPSYTVSGEGSKSM